MQVLRKAEVLVSPHLDRHRATEAGFGRIVYPGLQGTNCRLALVVVPVGQGSPHHIGHLDHLIMVLEGRVSFRAAGESVTLEEMDQVLIPGEEGFEYWNSGTGVCSFYSLVARSKEWPPPPTEYPDNKTEWLAPPREYPAKN